MMMTALLVLLCFTTGTQSLAQSGSIDPTFNPIDQGFGYGDGPNSSVYSSAVQSDGKIIIGGSFTSYNGTPINSIARLNTNSSLDTTFHAGTGAISGVQTILIQNDGKIIIGGSFSSYNGITVNRIARLNIDGNLDTTFNPGAGTDYQITAASLQSDGKILIVGNFTSYDGVPRNRIARLNIDGSLDTTFNIGSGANQSIKAIDIQNDGKIIIGGNFTSFDGILQNYIARLNADGSPDTSFISGMGTGDHVNATGVQSDGKIIIGGFFHTYDGTPLSDIARLNTDGSLDTTFNSGTGAYGYISTITLQNDEKIIITGIFSSYDGIPMNHIARINQDGSLDSIFDPGTGPDQYINSVTLQNDEKIIIGGSFTYYSGSPHFYCTRINTDGTPDSTFISVGTGANYYVRSITIQNDGKIIIGGLFTSYNGVSLNRIVRLNIDGSIDSTFIIGTGADNNVEVSAVQSDGRIIIGGGFQSYNGIPVNSIARLSTYGSLDTTFHPGIGTGKYIEAIAIQSDGKIIIGGSYDDSGVERPCIVRLNPNGSLDTNFITDWTSFGGIHDIIIQNDGKIIIGGRFYFYNVLNEVNVARLNIDGSVDTTYDPTYGPDDGAFINISMQNDEKILIAWHDYMSSLSCIWRVNNNGSLDTTFSSLCLSGSYACTSIQSDGKIILYGSFQYFNGTLVNNIARINSDGTPDSTFNSGTGASSYIITAAIQSDGKIIIGGAFTSYDGTGRNRIARINNIVSGEKEEETTKSFLRVYPNPTTRQVTLSVESGEIGSTYVLYNIQGRIVLTGNISNENNRVDLSGQPAGLYFIKLNNIDRPVKVIKL
jgi:uncharacterized delta-60 repeat protein